MEHQKRLSIIWRILRPIVALVLRIRFHYSAPLYQPQGPYIVVSNHVTDWDPLLVGAAFRNQMYFVASEHILRLGFISRLLNWLMAPIARQKGGSAAGAVKNILRTIKLGGNVAFFPEGNRTWDGVTAPFPASTGKLVRTSGATLITFRISGGYFASPRWSGNSCRKGKTSGRIVNTYTADVLKGMTPDEINDLIARDIHEDAYAQQEKGSIPFHGKRLAENMETYLFICPACGTMHKLLSTDDRFSCRACGAEARYSPTGRLLGGQFRFDNIRDWGRWQSKKLQNMLAAVPPDALIFSDSGFDLYRVHSSKGAELIAQGEVHLYHDVLELPGGITLPISEIVGMSLRGATDLYIGTLNGNHFQLKTAKVRNTVKYVEACRFLGAKFDCAV